MTVQTDENQTLNVLHRYDSADGREPKKRIQTAIYSEITKLNT